MNGGETIWDRLSRAAMALLALAIALGIILWYEPVVRANQRMREDKLALDQKIDTEIQAGKKLDAALRSMQDPLTVERLARERLSYAKPGEDVIHFEIAGGPLIARFAG